MKLILVRHGETEYNVGHINQGYLPGLLTTKGIIQAKKAGHLLKKELIAHIYCSPLERTRETLSHILKNHEKASVTYAEELSEHKLGIFEGKPSNSVAEYCKEHNLAFRSFQPEVADIGTTTK